jgi:pyrophosphatase PpaX
MRIESEKYLGVVILDLDGTLMDSVSFIEETFIEVLSRNGVRVTAEEFRKYAPQSPKDIFQALAPNLEFDTLLKNLRIHQTSLLHTLSPFPGVVESVRDLKEDGFNVAIASTRGKVTGIPLLESSGLSPYVDFSVFGDEVQNAKPHPEGINKILDSMGIAPENALMVGDAHTDILAGRNAGVRTVGVLTGHDRIRIIRFRPDLVLPNVSYLPRRISH